ncbi:MAG: hypothetical protein KIT72_03780 [Polyangiaceae bacterium]|nr:hypothetical protein [Polyangiaceae bacterium]MCW5789522.1 hypothetical protein [Polyangiaceae bacterium]
MADERTWREAISHVLGASAEPLHYNDITEQIVAQKLRRNLGATPAATVNAHIAASIKRDGHSSPYLRVARGVFALRPSDTSTTTPHDSPSESEVGEVEAQYDIITSFGMFWRRGSVEWTASSRLLGMQGIGAKQVDFYGQLGIYLLYDAREVIYVGRCTERPLGRRLYEHTLDRLSTRWDRFSWFGLLPISEDGEIGAAPGPFGPGKIIPALEAVLIEALEPRQNRKRGDDLAAVEYMQKLDPEIERRKKRATLEEALRKL